MRFKKKQKTKNFFYAEKAASWTARTFRLGLSLGKCIVAGDTVKGGSEGGSLGEYLQVKSISPFGFEDGRFQSRLDYFMAFQIKRQFRSREHVGDPRELWAWRAQRALGALGPEASAGISPLAFFSL